jgi:hypothetical protein
VRTVVYLKSARLEHGLLINFGSFKFEIRKFAWSENQPQRTQRTQSVPGFFISAFPALLSVRIIACREDFGVRWQSAAATPLFDCEQSFQSGVALRFPPQSKKIWLRLRRALFFAVK